MKVIAYKCFYVDKKTGQIWSSNKMNNNSGLEQEYFLDKINKPRFKFPIFAFKELEYAVRLWLWIFYSGSFRRKKQERFVSYIGCIYRSWGVLGKTSKIFLLRCERGI